MTSPRALVGPILTWYEIHRRDLPWRRPDATPWAILVSEFMLQQTPVARVVPAYEDWLARWPTPAALVGDSPGEAVRQWGRLGYPRRALRLHEVATAIVERHDGRVPPSYEDLVTLPGIGPYTAAAVASFAFRQRHVVQDTNVRRVLARAVSGVEYPGDSQTAAEARLGAELLPDEPETAARWAAAAMELGALVCTARAPRCANCPVSDLCAWRRAGYPSYDGPVRRGQTYAGTDRQVRGRLLEVLRVAQDPVTADELTKVWDDDEQRDRALAGLLIDGLVELVGDRYVLPRGAQPAV